VLEGHLALRLEANAGTENVGQGCALLSEGVDDGSTRGGQRGLEHVAENGQDTVEALELGGGDGRVGGRGLPLNTSHHLSNEDEIDDEGRGQEGVLANVEKAAQVSSGGKLWQGVSTYEMVW